jgi:hypothetical protein
MVLVWCPRRVSGRRVTMSAAASAVSRGQRSEPRRTGAAKPSTGGSGSRAEERLGSGDGGPGWLGRQVCPVSGSMDAWVSATTRTGLGTKPRSAKRAVIGLSLAAASQFGRGGKAVAGREDGLVQGEIV